MRRSRTRNFSEAVILPLVLVRPFRCADCKNRQYSLGFHRFRRFVSSTVALVLLAVASVAVLVFVGYVVMRMLFRA